MPVCKRSSEAGRSGANRGWHTSLDHSWREEHNAHTRSAHHVGGRLRPRAHHESLLPGKARPPPHLLTSLATGVAAVTAGVTRPCTCDATSCAVAAASARADAACWMAATTDASVPVLCCATDTAAFMAVAASPRSAATSVTVAAAGAAAAASATAATAPPACCSASNAASTASAASCTAVTTATSTRPASRACSAALTASSADCTASSTASGAAAAAAASSARAGAAALSTPAAAAVLEARPAWISAQTMGWRWAGLCAACWDGAQLQALAARRRRRHRQPRRWVTCKRPDLGARALQLSLPYLWRDLRAWRRVEGRGHHVQPRPPAHKSAPRLPPCPQTAEQVMRRVSRQAKRAEMDGWRTRFLRRRCAC